jgi:hypothetical protein
MERGGIREGAAPIPFPVEGATELKLGGGRVDRQSIGRKIGLDFENLAVNRLDCFLSSGL